MGVGVGHALEWSKVLGHSGKDDFYGASGIKNSFLLLAMNTAYSHVSLSQNVTEIELALLRIDTGEGLLDNCQTAIATSSGYMKALDLVSSDSAGMYLLAEVAAGTIRYMKTGLNYTFAQDSLAIILLTLDDVTSPASPSIVWVDVEAYPKPAKYAPTCLIPYYPSGIKDYGPPNFLLLAHIDESDRTGIVFYSFGTITASALGTVPSSKNPFVTGTGCTDTKALMCFSANVAYSALCNYEGSAYLAGVFACTSPGYPNGYYAVGKLCRACHYSCLTCDGPLNSQCLSCDAALRSYDSSTRRCNCAPNKYSSDGGCLAKCNSGHMGYTEALSCREACPSYTLHYVGYSDATSQPLDQMCVVGYSGGTDLLEFKSGSSGCLALPGPKYRTSVPSQFTASFWLYRAAGWTDAVRTVLWGFNTFKVVIATSLGVDTIKLVLKAADGTEISTVSTNGGGLVVGWNYVAVSVRKTSASVDTILYTTTDVVTLTNSADRSTGVPVFDYPTYTNTILLGCDGSFDEFANTITQVMNSPYDAYFRELVYQRRYNEIYSLHANKNRGYAPGQESYTQLLAYWRLDRIQTSSTGYTLVDDSTSALTSTLPLSSNPTKSISSLPSFSNYVWEDVGACVDLFNVGVFPTVSVNPQNFAVDGLLYQINMYSASILRDLLTSEDEISFNRDGCALGSVVQRLKVSLGTSSILLEAGKPLPISVYGTYLDVCYTSALFPRPVKLGQVYFPLVPEHASPAHGTSDGQGSSTLTFTLTGGDQSARDVLLMLNIETNVQSKVGDAYLVDESLSTYSSYMMARSASKTYSILTGDLDIATYTLLWRPAYLTSRSFGGTVEYKNLYVLWHVQDTPKIKFPTLDDGSGMTENGVSFKAEFFELNLIGPGQSDGDQVLFCISGCHHSNRRGAPYTRTNGKYPPVWLGEDVGVTNLLSSSDNRLFICWRPAARAAVLSPEEDTWNSVKEASEEGAKAYITIDSMSDNSDLTEIIDINPPLKDRVLRKGENIWFKLSKCSSRKVKPSCDASGVPGKVQVVHVSFTSGDLSTSFTTTVIWEQQFASAASSNDDGFTVGKLYGDPLTCNYTVTELPAEEMIPGHTYRLLIYGKSFKSPIMNNYFLGDVDSGTAQLQYEFVYQEARYNWTARLIPPSQTALEIPGENLGDVLVPNFGYRRLFAVNVSLSATCSGLETTYRVLSFKYSNPTAIKLTDLNLQSCVGPLKANIKLIKLNEYDEKPVWSYSTETLTLGTVGCYDTCAGCNGTGKYDCTSCRSTTNYQYLYEGECTNKCGVDAPYAYQNTANSEVFYHCITACPDGYFVNSMTHECVACNSQCKTCTSDEIMSCTSCQSIVVEPPAGWSEDSKIYADKFYFSHMCVLTCPVITNDISAAHEDLVSTDNITHLCTLGTPPSGSSPISVAIQPLPYRSRVNIQSGLKLRALIEDSTDGFAGITWQAHPAEDLAASGFNTSDKRTFTSYDSEYLSGQIVSINLNSLNYISNNDEKHIIVKVRTKDSLAIAFTELFGNLVMDFKECAFTFSPKVPTTMSPFSINVGKVEDPDDGQEILKFRVTLETVSLSVDTSGISESVLSTLVISTGISTRLITLYSLKPKSTTTASVLLDNIYIPPLIDGPQRVADGLSTNVVTCIISVIGEDKYHGKSVYSAQFNVTDTYRSSMRSTLIGGLYDEVVLSTKHANFSWDLGLKIANTFMTIVPVPKLHYLAYAKCARDSQCGKGKCVTAGGLSSCVCEQGFVGESCQWTQVELKQAKRIAESTIEFLNFTLIDPIIERLSLPQSVFGVDDIGSTLQLANILSGILLDPELLSANHMDVIVNLCNYLARISMHVAFRLDESEKTCILNGIDSVVKYLLRHIKDEVYRYYLLNDKKDQSDSYKAEYASAREQMAGYITQVRNSLYGFLNFISVAQYKGDAAFRKGFDAFEVFVVAATKDTLFTDFGDALGVQLSSENGFVKIPKSIISDLGAHISDGEDFMLRIVNWFESPYVFSTSNPEVYSTVQSVSILTNNATEIKLSLSEPIILFLPQTNWTRNFPHDRIKCKLFNSSLLVNATRARAIKLANVTSDSVEAQVYGYGSIVERVEYYTGLANFPDFVSDDGVSAYGGIFKSTDYVDFVPCAMFHDGEVAAVVERRRSQEREGLKFGFYDYFDPLAYWKLSLGFYTCMALVGIFGLTYIGVCFMDKYMIPQLEKLIQINRRDYNANETEMNDMSKSRNTAVEATQTKLRCYGAAKGRYGEDDTGELYKSKQNETQENDPRATGSPPGSSEAKVRPSKGAINDKDQEKDATLEKVEIEQSVELAVIKQANQDPRKRSCEIGVATTQALTTQEQALAMRTNVGNMVPEEDLGEMSFANVKAIDIRNKVKVDDRVEDVFSIEHIERREQFQYSVKNLILQGNLFTNLFCRTNTTLHRSTRCITVFLNIYLQMFWSAAFISATQSALDHPDDFKKVTQMMGDQMWIPFASPGFTMILLYLFSALFKVSDDRVLLTKTFEQYKRLQYLAKTLLTP